MKKEKLIMYIIILIFCFIICSPLLQMHIASDTYNLMDLGYFEYPSQYFLKDGRIISTIFTYLGGILNLDYTMFIILMEILAILICSISIYVLYNMFIDKTKEKEPIKKMLLLIGASLIIFNYMALEYLLYAECLVMCLSVLLSIISVKCFLEKEKYSNIKSLILLIVASYCYQGSINIFIPLVVLCLFIDKNNYSVKYIVKKTILAFVIFIICCISNILTIHVINLQLGNAQERLAGNTIFNNLSDFREIIKFVLARVLITNFNLLPDGTLVLFMFLFEIIVAFTQKSSDKITKYTLLILISFFVCIVPVFFMEKPGIEPRSSMAIGSIIGMSIIFLSSITNYDNKIVKNIVIIIAIACFMHNAINALYIFNAHIITNKIDEDMGVNIKNRIDEYEKKTGNIITKVAYYGDENERNFPYIFDKKLSSFTQRAFQNRYCIVEALNYYCDKKLEKTDMNSEIYEKYFKGKDWNTYSEEQIIFKDNVMYICIY